jgi:hypothetical protein
MFSGSIAGVVTDASDNPLAGIRITCTDLGGQSFPGGTVTTAADGSYALTALPANDYKILFEGGDLLIPEWYDDAADVATATPITVPDGVAVTGIDAVLQAAGAIRGDAGDGNGQPFEILEVIAYQERDDDEWIPVASTREIRDTAYLLGGLAPEPTRLRFRGTSFSDPQGGEIEFYDDETSLEAADNIQLVAGQYITIDANIGQATTGGISGTVEDQNGNPLGTVIISAFSLDTGLNYADYARPDGSYSMQNMVPGDYVVYFSEFTGAFAPQYYRNKTSFDEADRVDVEAGEIKDGIDAELEPAGGISGNVVGADGHPLQLVMVTAYDDDDEPVATTGTDPMGNYHLRQLPTEILRVGFLAVEFTQVGGGTQVQFLQEFYDDRDLLADADPISVQQGSTQVDINAVLDRDVQPQAAQASVVRMWPEINVLDMLPMFAD